MTTMNSYQNEVMRTAATTKERPMQFAILALGLAGEAGEAADMVKKHLGHGHELNLDKLTKELGDVLWYVAALADYIGVSLDSVACMNIDKLRARYPNGFSQEASKARVDLTASGTLLAGRGVDGDPYRLTER